MESPDDDIDAALDSYLAQLETDLLVVCDTGFAHDPESLTAKLDLDANLIQDTVDALIEECELETLKLIHINDIVNHASREFLMSSKSPHIIKTTANPDIPELTGDRVRQLAAATLRTIQIVADCAGPESEIHVSTHTDGTDARVQVRCETRKPVAATLLELRTCTLRALATELMGGFEIQCGPSAIQLTLSLPTKSASL